MNSLYTQGVRQTNSIQADLERLRNGDNSAPLLGQISASLAAMNRTVDDYDSMAKREIIKAKQEKAQSRVQKFRSDYLELKNEFDKLRVEKANEQASSARSELLSSSFPSSSDARRRYGLSNASGSVTPEVSESPFRTPTPMMAQARTDYALREHSFVNTTSQQLDDFIAQGQDVLNNLVDQRNMLKGTQRRLLDAANTLGLSREVIGWVERRSKQDTYIFFGGAAFTFFCFYLILKYFG
jgi:Golgi SNAP receptor complex protein 2